MHSRDDLEIIETQETVPPPRGRRSVRKKVVDDELEYDDDEEMEEEYDDKKKKSKVGVSSTHLHVDTRLTLNLCVYQLYGYRKKTCRQL